MNCTSHPRRPRRRVIALAAGAALASAATAQPAAPATTTIVVTGNPLGRTLGAQPTDVIAGDALLVQRQSTLGATLEALPGLASGGAGPNASRPVIRGLDGDRVRVLDNGGASIDVSSVSFDHALAIEPLVVERIEVLRGPAALLYGGSAIGGVVNTIDNRIPRGAPAAALTGRAELRLGGAASERAGAAVVEGALGSLAWHADGFERRQDDQRVPGGRVVNSAASARGGAAGASWIDARGYAGASLDRVERDYGVVVDPAVTIRMQRERAAFAAERRLAGPFEQLEVQASRTRYRHDEVEGGGEIGTRFRSSGSDGRVQLRHAPLGGLRGVAGWQGERLEFSALGAEAFVPATRTRSNAVFALEEIDFGAVRASAGLRAESVSVASAGDGEDGAGRFGAPQQRRFGPRSAALSLVVPLPSHWSVAVTAGRSQRAPAYYELYANGAHVASGAYERGDAALGSERSRHGGITFERRSAGHEARLALYTTRFANYIALEATGSSVARADGDTLPEYVFRAVRARLAGAEAESRWRFAARDWRWTVSALADTVRGTNLDSGEALPRLAPWRLQLAAEGTQGLWAWGFSVRHVAAQRRVPATDTPTPGYDLASAWLRWSPGRATWFVRVDNVGNALAYNASAAATVRALSPLPRRALSAGVRVTL